MKLTIEEFAKTLNYLLDVNRYEIDNGRTPKSICIDGQAGIGKTSILKRVAKDRNMDYCCISLAQLEEPSDLIGFPLKEYKVIDKNDNELWVSVDILGKLKDIKEISGEYRMGYASPSWLPREENPNGTILVLDDFSRANSLIMQSIMELINTGSYTSWHLPKYTTICLSSNPDDGSYSVTSLDIAQRTRMIMYSCDFDVKEWAAWAEMNDIDSRAINFALLYSRELFESKNNVTLANARTYETFCRIINLIEDWEKPESLAKILTLCSGCFEDKDDVIGSLFTQFLANKLDKLIQPEDMINQSWETVSKRMLKCIYDDETSYRSDIASVLGLRLLNFLNANLGSDKAKTKIVEKRLEEIITFNEEKKIFSQDILLTIIKSLNKNHARETNKWLANSIIRKMILD